MKKLSRLLFAGALYLFMGTSVSGIQAASQDGYMTEGHFDGERASGGIYGPYSTARADYNGGCYTACEPLNDFCSDAPRGDCCSRFAFGVDYLYWDVSESGLDVVKITVAPKMKDSECGCGNPCVADTEFFKFKPKSGYRLGASYLLPCWNDVSLNFVFTYFHPKVNNTFHNRKVSESDVSIIQITTDMALIGEPNDFKECHLTNHDTVAFVFFNTPESTVHTRVKLKYELYDLVLSKNYGCDCWTVTAYAGARVLWVRESLQNSIEGAYAYTYGPIQNGYDTTWKRNVPAGGLTVGVHGRYIFCGSLNVIGHFGLSVLGGKSKYHTNYDRDNARDKVAFKNRAHRSQIIQGWDGSLGLGYDMNFCTCPVRLGVGYEIQNWFNLPERVRYTSTYRQTDWLNRCSTVQPSDAGGCLTVHGLFVRMAFAF